MFAAPASRATAGTRLSPADNDDAHPNQTINVHDKSEVYILQANVHHSIAAVQNLTGSIQGREVDVYLLQELYMRGGKPPFTPTGYQVFIPPGPEGVTARAAVFVKTGLPAFIVPEFCNRDLCTISLCGRLLASAYFPAEEASPPELVRELIAHSDARNLYLLVGCDSNSHNTAWASTRDRRLTPQSTQTLPCCRLI